MNKTRLTASEWEIYECLWEEAPLTLAQLRKRYAQRTGQAVSTAETTVTRMEKKGLFRVERGERAKLFYPLFPREEAVKEETRSFLDRIFGGSPLSLVSSMVNGGQLSDREIEELHRLLDQEMENRHG